MRTVISMKMIMINDWTFEAFMLIEPSVKANYSIRSYLMSRYYVGLFYSRLNYKSLCDWTLHNKLKASILITEPSTETDNLKSLYAYWVFRWGKLLSNPVLFNKVGSFYSRLNHKGLFWWREFLLIGFYIIIGFCVIMIISNWVRFTTGLSTISSRPLYLLLL